MHMGAENMGPFLYQLCRFTKPENVLEIGAGYTSVYLMQALRDNKKEIEVYERMREEHSCVVRNEDPHGKDTPWSNEAYFSKRVKKENQRDVRAAVTRRGQHGDAHDRRTWSKNARKS